MKIPLGLAGGAYTTSFAISWRTGPTYSSIISNEQGPNVVALGIPSIPRRRPASVPPSPTDRNASMHRIFVCQSIILGFNALPWLSGMGTFAALGFSSSTNKQIWLVHSILVLETMHCHFDGNVTVTALRHLGHCMKASICRFRRAVSTMILVASGTSLGLDGDVNDDKPVDEGSTNTVVGHPGVLVASLVFALLLPDRPFGALGLKTDEHPGLVARCQPGADATLR